MNRLKKAIAISTVSSTFLLCGAVFAASGKYSSTYSITGGVESKRFDVGKYTAFTGSVYPTHGVWIDDKKQATIELQLKKDIFGLDPEYVVSTVPSVTGGKRTLTSDPAGIYYIYYRNYTGERMKGETTISWKY